MGILTLLQHKEAAVATPPAKNTSVFVAETEEGAGENKLLAERPAFKTAAGTFFRFITADSRNILGTSLAEALKEETEANSVTGIKPSATKQAMVWVGLKAEEAVSTAWVVEVGGKIVGKVTTTPKVSDFIPIGTFYVPANETIKLTKTSGKISGGVFGVTLMN